MKKILQKNLYVSLMLSLATALTACQPAKNNDKTNTPTAQSSTTASTATPANASDTANAVDKNTPLTKLVAMTLNNGFLLAIKNHQQLNDEQKACLVKFDETQSIIIAHTLLNQHLTKDEMTEANEFYQLPIGQKLIQFNQAQSDMLHQSTKEPTKVQFSDDESLQIGAFLQTPVGQKIQNMANTALHDAFLPIETAQLRKCQVSAELFNTVAQPSSAPTPTPASTTH